MTKLRTLQSQLASLRRWRQWFRWGTGYAGLLIALLWILAAVFVLDYGFKLEVPQRAIVIVIGLAGLVWAAMRYTAPFLGIQETPIDMALLVERQQGIDSDLVAALQFESPEADKWGSRQLEDAVVDYVAQLDRGLDVFDGFSRKQFWARAGILAGSALLAVLLIFNPVTGPYAHAFFMRLTLDNLHYPSATSIDRVLVNADEVLIRGEHGTTPIAARSAQSQPIVFAAWASGDLPDKGVANVRPVEGPGSERPIEMTKASRGEIETASKLLRRQLAAPSSDEQTPVAKMDAQAREDFSKLLAGVMPSDPAKISAALELPEEGRLELKSAANRLDQLLAHWPADGKSQLYVGKMPRLADKVAYKIELGDAWTDSAAIEMIELPTIEPNIVDIPPDYARTAGESQDNDRRSLQRSVIEGSQVQVAIGASKPLAEATLSIMTTESGKQSITKHPLKKVAGKVADHWPPVKKDQSLPEEVWRLDTSKTELGRIAGPVRFEIQVTDEDGLSLETPLRGAIRLKADRPPRIAGSLVHRVLLPTAQPELELRAGDDYGLASMAVHVSVVRGEFGSADSTGRKNEAVFPIKKLYELRGTKTPTEASQRPPIELAYELRGDELPVVGAFVLEDLASLKLTRGDEVRITLSATDYRGENLPGVTSESEPIILEITDESGILAAVSEGDRRSQEQIDDLIRRQLGIGETD